MDSLTTDPVAAVLKTAVPGSRNRRSTANGKVPQQGSGTRRAD